MMQLRSYQSEAVSAIYGYFAERKGDAPLVVAPTGSGKSVIIAEFIRRALDDYPTTRILMATHQRELIQQNYQALLRLWPQAPAGIYSAGLGKRQARAQVLFAGVQSVHRKAREIGHVDLMFVDEAHLMPRSADTQYGRLVETLREINPAMKLVGATATPYRLDSGCLHRGDAAIFDGIAFDIPVAMLVTQGYLSPLISKRPDASFDTRGLHKRAGDFIEGEMMARFGTDEATEAAVSEMVELGAERKSWLAFCISVDHARQVRDVLRVHGLTAEMVTGETPSAERDRLLRQFKEGQIRCLTNCNVLTTGFDAPRIDLIAMLRPTASTGLYIQMAGRGMRLAEGKADCLVLDFAGNVMRHGPIDAIAPPGEKKASDGDGEAPAKVCPNCDSILLISARECPDCGHLFPPPEPKVERTATTEAIMNLTAVEQWHPVADVDYQRHKKDGSPDSLRVTYLINRNAVSEWVCFEHSGYARQKAVAWWQTWAGTPPPDKTGEALARIGELERPAEAVIERDGKYHRIKKLRKAKVMA
jgi:DNA repair protein RadD